MKKIRNCILLLAAIAGLNMLIQQSVWRIDLTADKRYTLSEASKEQIRSIDAPLYLTLYLDGSMNSGFRTLKNSVLDMVRDMQRYNSNIHISGIDEDEREKEYGQLEKNGYGAVYVHERQRNGQTAQTRLYPYLSVQYNGRRMIVSLLKQQRGRSGEENLNMSREGLEYAVIEAVHTLAKDSVDKVAFIEGHGELTANEVYDLSAALSQYFQVDRGVLGSETGVLDIYKAVIVADPQTPFSETDKFIIDQYLMQGGKVMWLLNGVRFSEEMLTDNGVTPVIPLDLNLTDMLFRYGVRVNSCLVQDMQCLVIPVDVSPQGQQPQYQPMPWTYAPLLLTSPYSPVTRDVMQVSGTFVSCIDLVGGDDGLKKELLLVTSNASAFTPAPSEVDLSDLTVAEEMFRYAYLPVAVSLEGSFPSVYAHRFAPEEITAKAKKRDSSEATRQIVAAAGSIARNEWSQGQSLPVGYDRYTKTQFGNRDFLVNAVLWLTDDNNLIQLRQKTVALRLINTQNTRRMLLAIQAVSVIMPLMILLLTGLPVLIVRKHRYAR